MCTGCLFTGFALNTLLSNHIVPNQVGLHSVSRLVCAKTCSERPSCKSFFYTPTTQSCLLSHRYYKNTAGLVPFNGTSFYTKPLPGCITKKYHFVEKLNVCVLDKTESRMSWNNAESYCTNNHGMLMKAHNSIRHQYFLEIGKKIGHKRMHIGGKKTGNLWQWLDGVTIENDHWRAGGRDSFLSALVNTHLEYCLCDGAYTWDDARGNNLYGFLCESRAQM